MTRPDLDAFLREQEIRIRSRLSAQRRLRPQQRIDALSDRPNVLAVRDSAGVREFDIALRWSQAVAAG